MFKIIKQHPNHVYSVELSTDKEDFLEYLQDAYKLMDTYPKACKKTYSLLSHISFKHSTHEIGVKFHNNINIIYLDLDKFVEEFKKLFIHLILFKIDLEEKKKNEIGTIYIGDVDKGLSAPFKINPL